MTTISSIPRKLCTGCLICADACHYNAITTIYGPLGFSYPSINKKKCIECGKCINVCPVAGNELSENSEKLSHNQYYAAKANDEHIRKESTSGGIFPLLSEFIIQQGGSVVGASLTSTGEVRHIFIDSTSEIEKLTKTKYVQSSTLGIYFQVLELLKQDRKVLFAGTPCQAEALRYYTKGYSTNLYIIDLVCYGVPSPQVWKTYIHFLEQKYQGHLDYFYFRDKRNHDDGHTVVASINNEEHPYSIYEDDYCRTYFKNINIRESCLNCRFTTTNRNSDITIGDFWGIENVSKEYDDKEGTSLLIIHTKKGKGLFEKIKNQISYIECEEEKALQPRLQTPTIGHKNRAVFTILYKILPFSIWLKIIKNWGKYDSND